MNRGPARAAGQMTGGPALKILLYVDAEELMPGRIYGPDTLVEALAAGQPAVQFDVRSRTDGERLTKELLEPFDEAWFFLKAVDGDTLVDEEKAALREWMDCGHGVLVAGDHAVKRSGEIVGLGAEVGEWIPRAGDMRLWNAPPSLDPADRIDSIDAKLGHPSPRLNWFERDEKPQRLLLPVFDGVQPHPIFRDSDGTRLERFPDHMHEGKVKLSFDPAKSEWAGVTEETGPKLVAWGIDWRHGRPFELMAAWDGHAVPTANGPRGRIVTDSSFHHYVNDNLEGIAAVDGEDWRKIRALYRNLAAWLAPPAIKRAHIDRALAWLAGHDRIADLDDHGDEVVGQQAMDMLAEVLPGAWLHEMIDDLVAGLRLQRAIAKVPREAGPYVLGASVRVRMQLARGEASTRRRARFKAGQVGEAAAPRTEEPRTAAVIQALDDYGKALKAKQAELEGLVAALQEARDAST